MAEPYLVAPPAQDARIDPIERWRTNSRFGDLSASQLARILRDAEQGDVADWADLCEYVLTTDPTLGGLHGTRRTRVTQADRIIKPSKFGNPRLAELAAEFVNEQFGRIRNWHDAEMTGLDAIAVGYSPVQLRWEHERRVGSKTGTSYVSSAGDPHIHRHRFRYDEQWKLRLYDRGMKRGEGSMYGQRLRHGLWIDHYHATLSGYPGVYGQLRPCIWPWLMGHWVDKFWMIGIERNGPIIHAGVPKNTQEKVRRKILADLEALANTGVGVHDDNIEVEVEAAIAATKTHEAYSDYQKRNAEKLTTNYLGAADAVAPGANGSQAAVSARISSSMDPRMVVDGDGWSSTLQRTLFTYLIEYNPHKFGAPLSEIPIPEQRFKTADDEVKRDSSDRAVEIRDELESEGVDAPAAVADPAVEQPGQSAAPASDPTPSDAGPVAAATSNVQQQALNGAQVTSLLEIITQVVDGRLPRASAKAIIVNAFPVGDAQAEQMLGEVGQGFVPTEPEPEPGGFGGNPFQNAQATAPKARPRSERGASGRPATGSRSPSLIARALSSASVASVSSPRNR